MRIGKAFSRSMEIDGYENLMLIGSAVWLAKKVYPKSAEQFEQETDRYILKHLTLDKVLFVLSKHRKQ